MDFFAKFVPLHPPPLNQISDWETDKVHNLRYKILLNFGDVIKAQAIKIWHWKVSLQHKDTFWHRAL